jgi:hypothetical protein
MPILKQDQLEHVGTPRRQNLSRPVRSVVKGLERLLHAQSGVLRDVRTVVDDTPYRLIGDAHLIGDIAERRSVNLTTGHKAD